jgi:hypothetical protein
MSVKAVAISQESFSTVPYLQPNVNGSATELGFDKCVPLSDYELDLREVATKCTVVENGLMSIRLLVAELRESLKVIEDTGFKQLHKNVLLL